MADALDDISTFSATHPEMNTTAAEQPAAQPDPAAPSEAAPAGDHTESKPDAKAEEEANSNKPDKELSEAGRKLRASRADARKAKFQADIDAKRKELGDIEREIERRRREIETPAATPAKKDTHDPADRTAAPTPAAEQAPTPDQFDTYEQYLDARDRYRETQREQRQAIERAQAERARVDAEIAQTAIQRFEEFKKEHSDFDALLEESHIQLRASVIREIQRSDFGPQIVYGLLKDAKAAAAFERLPIADQVKEIGRREARLEAASKATKAPRKPVSSAPDAIEPVGGPSAAARDLSDLDTDDYIDRMNEQEAARRSGKR